MVLASRKANIVTQQNIPSLDLTHQMILKIKLPCGGRNLHIPKDAALFQTPKMFNQIPLRRIKLKEESMKRLVHPRSLKVETT